MTLQTRAENNPAHDSTGHGTSVHNRTHYAVTQRITRDQQ